MSEGPYRYLGINHLALTCSNMDQTIHFYRDVLGMPLVKTIELAGGRGKHYFFDVGGGDCLAFFEFPKGPRPVDARTHLKISATPGMMNHVAFGVSNEDLDRYRERLVQGGIEVTEVVNHDDSERGASPEVNETTFLRSIYFRDPDGFQLEFTAWTRDLNAQDVSPRYQPQSA